MLRRAALATTFLMVLSTASVSAATSTVVVSNNKFTPTSSAVALGDSVSWDKNTLALNTHHTSTSNIGLWDSDLPAGTDLATVEMDSAGTFAYHCKIHGSMQGTVAVGMMAAPTTGHRGDSFEIRWATADSNGSVVYDVQKKRPGRTFKNWQVGVSSASQTFVPARKGTFQFRVKARLGGQSSTYSPILSITVN